MNTRLGMQFVHRLWSEPEEWPAWCLWTTQNKQKKKNKKRKKEKREKGKKREKREKKKKKVLFCSAAFNHSHTWNLTIELHFFPAIENLQYRILEGPAVDNEKIKYIGFFLVLQFPEYNLYIHFTGLHSTHIRIISVLKKEIKMPAPQLLQKCSRFFLKEI